ncbi:MAG: hypothetical protein ABI298_04480 [Acidimicrobiales bacterium]
MTQPTFSPVTQAGMVRATMETGTAEFSRPPKPGLLRVLPLAGKPGRGTQAPGEGFALTIAQRECAKFTFEHEHDRGDVALGVALVAAKRASIVGRGPQLDDVRVVMDLFGLRGAAVIDHVVAAPFSGIAHSYVLQRKFVDAVDASELVASPIAQPSH